MTSSPATAGISVNAISASFRQPFETARRHVNALIAQDFCYRDGPRILVSPERLTSRAFEQALTLIHDAMVRLVEECHTLGIPLPEPRCDAVYHPDTTIAVAIDALLAAYEYGAPHYASWLQMRVMSAVLCANGRRIASDPDLAERYGIEGAAPPDALIVPVTGRAVARAIRLPYPTVRRQIDAALEQGWLVRNRGGVKRSRAHAASPLSTEFDRAACLRVIKAFERLAPVGFRFDDPAGHYAGREPPPLLDFS